MFFAERIRDDSDLLFVTHAVTLVHREAEQPASPGADPGRPVDALRRPSALGFSRREQTQLAKHAEHAAHAGRDRHLIESLGLAALVDQHGRTLRPRRRLGESRSARTNAP